MCRPYGWVSGPKFSKQGSLFRLSFLKHGWVIQKLAKKAKMGRFSPKFITKVNMKASFGNWKRKNRAADPRLTTSVPASASFIELDAATKLHLGLIIKLIEIQPNRRKIGATNQIAGPSTCDLIRRERISVATYAIRKVDSTKMILFSEPMMNA